MNNNVNILNAVKYGEANINVTQRVPLNRNLLGFKCTRGTGVGKTAVRVGSGRSGLDFPSSSFCRVHSGKGSKNFEDIS